ncbi:dihydrodipicolinate synthase family protein [Brevibacterium oceani]|uniref:dihydrodipicolinate synthase family protein n=1 Tax=Brevibacterium oceani TaxID=358099 RepID=UPI0015E752C5|nr:dihydrodipicolinate synthase family protein [Brevibacterium oceani]
MTLDEIKQRLADVVAIVPTPFNSENAIDANAHRSVVGRLTDGGISVLTANGNTSEFYTLTEAEIQQGVTLTVEAMAEGSLLLAGVGFDIDTAIRQAHFARDHGAHAIMIHQPVHPYVSRQGWVAYNRIIAEAVPELGVVPYVRNPLLEATDFNVLIEACPNVMGVKYSVPDPVRFGTVAREVGIERITWIAGLAEPAAPGYAAMGAHGFTSGLASIAPELSRTMSDSLREGDFPAAMEIWDSVREFEQVRAEQGSADNVSAVKEALSQLGLGRADVRPPGARLSPENRQRVARILETWGLL